MKISGQHGGAFLCDGVGLGKRAIPDKTLSEVCASIEEHIKNTYFKRVQAPIGVRAVLNAWMELSG